MHLWCKFYVSRPLFGEDQLSELQSVIADLLPGWAGHLCAAKHEDSRDYAAVAKGDRLYDGIHRAAPPKRGLGSAVLTGAYETLSFFLSHCDRTLPPELNDFAIESYGPTTVEGRDTSVWARATFEALAARLPVRYANAHLDAEYRAKNMIDDASGVRAIGARITYALPGLYWLNFFGRPYVDLIGAERLLSAPAYEVKKVDDGVLIALDSSAEAWKTAKYRQREQAVIEHLGGNYFFSRHEPDRQTVGPDFKAYLDRPVA
jgi:hypothetical protein